MNNELKEKLFDLVLTEALKEYMEIELQEIDEMVAAMPEYKPSAETERKIKKISNSLGRKARIKKYKQICVKVAKVFVIVSAIMGVIFIGLLTQPVFYTAVQNVIRSIFGK